MNINCCTIVKTLIKMKKNNNIDRTYVCVCVCIKMNELFEG